MTALILGLLLFLGAHSVRIVAEGWRGAQLARLGEQRWKGLYSIASLAGFALIVWGYGAARMEPVMLWQPPLWTRHLAALLTLPAFVLIAAAYAPDNRLRTAIGHPMVVGVKVWALAHLIANGTLADVILFGSFLAWALFDFRAARRRDAAAGVRRAPATLAGDAVTLLAGIGAWAAFAFYLHAWLIGVPPL
jgi:uncharacterized membrane protein